MNTKTVKKILLPIAGIVAILILWLFATAGVYSITHPTISLEVIDKPIDSSIISAKQVEAYLSNEIHYNKKLDKYNLKIGSIEMKIDDDHKGEVTVIFVQREIKRPKVVFAYLDTRKGIFNRFQDFGRESRLYPGIINLREWSIDSTDAVRITEEFFSDKDGFRYDEIWLYSYNDSLADYSGSEEGWLVYLTDKINNIRYNTRINPYSGEVVTHF